MSASPEPPPPSVPPQQRSGCTTAFMVIAGIILLLPGLCALLFAGGPLITEGRFESGFAPFILIGLLVGFAGVMLICSAIRGPRS